MPPKSDYTSGISATALKPLAAVIYAAAASEDDKMMQYVGSTILNRLKSGKKEFGAENGSIIDVIKHPGAYYEKNSQMYQDFMTGNFKDDKSKAAAMRAASIASALQRGSLETMPGEFWWTDDEIAKGTKSKAFDIKKLEKIGDIGKKGQFRMYGYPSNPNGGKTVALDPSVGMNEYGFDKVDEFQQFLKDNGKYTGAIDGKYGPKTHKAYLAFKNKTAG